MLKLELSGGYQIEGHAKLPRSADQVHCQGFALLLQIDDYFVVRGEFVPAGHQVSQPCSAPGRSPAGGVLLDFSARFVAAEVTRKARFEGQMTLLDWHNLRPKHANRVEGVVDLEDKSIAVRLGLDPILGDVVLRPSFPLGDISRNEIWSDLYRTHLSRVRPWTLISSHERLQGPLRRYLAQSRFETNVFVMMRFAPTEQNLLIRATVADRLRKHGLVGQFADSLTYAEDLWDNVCTYMIGSRFGVAVIEEIEERVFNPNVAMEIGFMRAIQRRVLVLKDKRVPRLPADLIGQIYKEFDSYDLKETISAQIDAWTEELRVLRELPRGPTELLEFFKAADSIFGVDELKDLGEHELML